MFYSSRNTKTYIPCAFYSHSTKAQTLITKDHPDITVVVYSSPHLFLNSIEKHDKYLNMINHSWDEQYLNDNMTLTVLTIIKQLLYLQYKNILNIDKTLSYVTLCLIEKNLTGNSNHNYPVSPAMRTPWFSHSGL